LNILGGFDFTLINFEISFFILSIAFSGNFLYFKRNEKILAELNFSFGILITNSFANSLIVLVSLL